MAERRKIALEVVERPAVGRAVDAPAMGPHQEQLSRMPHLLSNPRSKEGSQ